ncbi:TolC family protein [Marinigracilibium pacificum]|uniref:TolC family protein n=1 Tax=Marinigracilibium pacificum TaxID=2729599 RepID=A0A848J0J4_9BACT|nr:TolC family protein [Marinigracilibium pacificum]NMM48070.1 TolC family protein [Marinigracilibium pacificum]
MKRIFTLLFLMAVGLTANAQNQADTLWTLEECIEYAVQNNIDLQITRLSIDESESSVKNVKFDYLPSLSIGGSYGSQWGRSIDPTTNEFTTNQLNTAGVSANAQWIIYAGLRTMRSLQQSKVNLERTQYDFERSRNELSLRVANLFLNVIFNKELVESAEIVLESSSQQYERTKRMVEVGSMAKSEELQLASQVASNELQLIQAKNDLQYSKLLLKQALRIESDVPFDIVVPELDAAQYSNVIVNKNSIYQAAIDSLPDLRSAELSLESSEYDLKISRGALLPSLSLNANYGTNFSSSFQDQFPEYNFGRQFEEFRNYSVRASINIPIFNNWDSRFNIQRSKISRDRAELTYKNEQLRIRQEIEQASNDVAAARLAYQAAEKATAAAEEAYRMARQQADAGAINVVDLTIAQSTYIQAQNDLTRNKYDYIFKLKVLDYYQGKKIEL